MFFYADKKSIKAFAFLRKGFLVFRKITQNSLYLKKLQIMPEVIIKYEKLETLKVLEGLAESLNFEITNLDAITLKRKKALEEITVPANKEADLSQLFEVFTGKNLDAKTLREQLWRTKK